jgi:hypothetical protein
MTRDGTLFASNGVNKTFCIRDGAITQYDDKKSHGNLAMHPGGEWGIYFHSCFMEKVHLNESGMTVEEWALSIFSDEEKQSEYATGIQCLSISDDRIYAAVYNAATPNTMTVSAFDFEGRELFAFGSQDELGSDQLSFVTDVVQTQNSIVILDIGTQTLKVFSMDGTFLGAVNCNQLWAPTMLKLYPSPRRRRAFTSPPLKTGMTGPARSCSSFT